MLCMHPITILRLSVCPSTYTSYKYPTILAICAKGKYANYYPYHTTTDTNKQAAPLTLIESDPAAVPDPVSLSGPNHDHSLTIT